MLEVFFMDICLQACHGNIYNNNCIFGYMVFYIDIKI